MFVYKSEIFETSYKFISDSANQKDVARFDKLINKKYADGWELVAHSYMVRIFGTRSKILVTFRKQKQAMTAKELLESEC